MKLRLLWFALFTTTVIFFVIAFLFGQTGASKPFVEALHGQWVFILYPMALILFILNMSGVVLRDLPLVPRFMATLGNYEACSVWGLMCALSNDDWRLYLAPWALTIIGFLRAFPMSEAS